MLEFIPGLEEKLNKDAENNIKIFECKIKFNGGEFKRDILDNFLELIQNFDVNLLERTNEYDENLYYDLKKIIYSIDDLNTYLKVRTSNGKENDSELETNVNKFRNAIKIMKDELI